MNAREFKATALKCSDHYSVDFCTKKEMLDRCTDCDGETTVGFYIEELEEIA